MHGFLVRGFDGDGTDVLDAVMDGCCSVIAELIHFPSLFPQR